MSDEPPSPSRSRSPRFTSFLPIAILAVPLATLAQSPAPDGGVPLARVALVALLLLVSALLSASEAALVALSPWRVRQLREEGAGGDVFGLLEEDPGRLLTTLQIANTIVNLAVAGLAVDAATRFARGADVAPAALLAGALAFAAVLVLGLGEVLPRALGAARPAAVGRRVLRSVDALAVVLAPPRW